MALSTGLMSRLRRDNSDEPLTKRLKLAENVLYSPDILIAWKEDCVFRWLYGELSGENNSAIWMTIHRCLSTNPRIFTKLSLDSRKLLTAKLIQSLCDFPDKHVSKEILKCCEYIFSFSNGQSYSIKNNQLPLIKALLTFAFKVLNNDGSEHDDRSVDRDLAMESVECAIGTVVKICKQNFSDEKSFATIFIEELLFPLASLVETIKIQRISSKLIIKSQKCIKNLMFGSARNIALPTNDKYNIAEESEAFLNILQDKINAAKFQDVKAVLTLLFESVVNTCRHNSTIVDTILRRLWKCIEQKEQSKQILAALLDNSTDVSFNFDNEIDGRTLKLFLETQIEELKSKKKRFKCSDYELLTAIAKLNPLIIESAIQDLLERMFFERRTCEKEMIAYENLITELWKATVRLRRQHKFLSKFLLAINCSKEKEIDIEFVNTFKLPEIFIAEFCKDLRSQTTSAQILAIFNTLLFHLKTDCLKTLNTITRSCLSLKIVASFIVAFFEHVNFLDGSLTQDWQIKFYQTFTDLQSTLAVLSETLCESNSDELRPMIFIAFSTIANIWCEAYDLLRYYVPNIACNELSFPITETQLKSFKQMIKERKNQDCTESLNRLMLMKLVNYDRNNMHTIKEKIIVQLWPVIMEDHFQIIESLNEMQILKLTLHFVKEACSTSDNLSKWTSVLNRNMSRMTKVFATAAALQILSNIVEDIESTSTRTIIENIDFEAVLKSMDDQINCKKALKHATKEIAKQDFKSLNTVDADKIKRNLIFMSNLPLSILNSQIKKFLFLVLYVFDEETKHVADFKEAVGNLYTDLLYQNNFDILNSLSEPVILINHFKDNQIVLFKIFKSSLNKVSVLSFWQEFVDKEDCNRKMSSILLICIESSKNKPCMSNQKDTLQNLYLKLSNKIVEELDKEISSLYEIAGLRILVKAVLTKKQRLDDNLKSCIELTLKSITKDTEKLYDDKLIHEILQLSLIVLEHRKHFLISEDIIKNLCIIYINNPNGKIFFHFLEILKDNEFQFFINNFNKKTKESLLNSNTQALEKLTKIWENLSKAETKVTRAKALKTSVNNLFKDLLALEIKDSSCIFFFKICRTFVTSKRMIRLTHILVDSIFVSSMECLNNLNKENKLSTCQEALGLCLDFMRSKLDFLLDRLTILTNLFRKIIKIVFQEAKDIEFSDERMLKILAIDIEKFCTFFAKLKKDVVRISPYLIADLIEVSHATVLPHFLKMSIEFSISHILSNCDRHAISYLSRTLPTLAQQVFKSTYQNYIKYNKFTGKI
ncbi:PREDICTED: uncharacterized protein LOC105361237 [Ceratosolen solmsi marchali]|uniref:Uncharacterized protein LOC105361237 n=1 Tax=Ceratosolen solmsi marchali TaxID=326594 RepID=A0AAJ7DU85_9HYME|nr:PREDICTED: uncharacterized protein LOC105361237 [Ceratosolen solmsi marchali]